MPTPRTTTEQAILIPDILPDTLVAKWLAQDPVMQAADSSFSVNEAEAAQVDASPYEWTANFSRQQRAYETGPHSNEWNFGIERTFRLPGKVSADEATANALRHIAQARRNQDRRQAIDDLYAAWFDWLQAQSRRQLLAEQYGAANQSVAAVTARVRGGDAALLEQKLAAAELSAIEGELRSAEIAETSAWAMLSARYPVEGYTAPALPDPQPIVHDGSWWQQQIIAASDALDATRANVVAAQASVDRARADRVPDPTIGVFTGREAFGDEQIVGINLSVPFPGARRSQELQKQLALADSAKQQLTLQERLTTGAARAAYATATGTYARWQLAITAARTLQENARLMQKAYTLGEQDFQALLLARRQALTATESEAAARIDALRSYVRLLLDAKVMGTRWWGRHEAQADEP
ncbi:TolC family protein [Permianibacter sp. IMCC34836]|uniref:TolC family protein n=1 Tax=Permianibacter fluminis TaxID=2738515 RepID=UPI001551BD9B|nr:TolC family protein [Permianibacter fluminis]NQD38264.1 TolC family protein [Permianibacter fluminis]